MLELALQHLLRTQSHPQLQRLEPELLLPRWHQPQSMHHRRQWWQRLAEQEPHLLRWHRSQNQEYSGARARWRLPEQSFSFAAQEG